MLLYLHLIDFKIFFHPAKFDNFKDETISDYKFVSVSQSQILAGLKTFGLYVLRGKKKIKNILATALKSYIKWLIHIFFFLF